MDICLRDLYGDARDSDIMIRLCGGTLICAHWAILRRGSLQFIADYTGIQIDLSNYPARAVKHLVRFVYGFTLTDITDSTEWTELLLLNTIYKVPGLADALLEAALMAPGAMIACALKHNQPALLTRACELFLAAYMKNSEQALRDIAGHNEHNEHNTHDIFVPFYEQWIEDRRDQFVLFEVSAALDSAGFMQVLARLDFTTFTAEQLETCSEHPLIAHTTLSNLFACMARMKRVVRSVRSVQSVRRRRLGKN
jgi:hypothetical protein